MPCWHWQPDWYSCTSQLTGTTQRRVAAMWLCVLLCARPDITELLSKIEYEEECDYLQVAGIFTPNEEIAASLKSASQASGERLTP